MKTPIKNNRKFLFTCLSIAVVISLISSPILNSYRQHAYASPGSWQISISTGDRDFGGVATIRIDYTLNADVSHPSSTSVGETTDWQVTLKDGFGRITINAAGQTFSPERDLPLGESISIPVTPGIDLQLFSTAKAPLDVIGPAFADIGQLSWQSEGTKTFRLSVSGNAAGGETIMVRIPVMIDLNLGVSVLGFKFASTSLGIFETSPVIEESMVIAQVLPPLTTVAIIGGIVAAIGIGVGVIVARRRKRR